MCGVDALGDIGRLAADTDVDAGGRAVEALLRRVVADLQDAFAHDVVDIGERLFGRGGHLTDDMHLAGGDGRLDRHARLGIDGQQRVEDRIADGVTDLVGGVSFGDRLAGKQPTCAHSVILQVVR